MTGVTAAQLLTAEQLAERWQVPASHVYRLTRDGKIPVVGWGGTTAIALTRSSASSR